MNFKKITALSLALALSAGITVNAATSLPATEKSDKEGKKIELKEGFFKKRHHGDGLYRTAKEIGITKEEMKNAREKGTNFFDMAKQKGFTEQQVKDMMLKNKSEALDKEVENGKLTKEKAEEIKNKMKEKISNWDGILRNHKGKIENKEDEKKKQ